MKNSGKRKGHGTLGVADTFPKRVIAESPATTGVSKKLPRTRALLAKAAAQGNPEALRALSNLENL